MAVIGVAYIPVVDAETLMAAEVDGRARPETISIAGYKRICRAMAMR